VSVGSSGVHHAYCEASSAGEDGAKWWWHPEPDGSDLWPHKPILYLPDDEEREADEKRAVVMRERWAKYKAERNAQDNSK
jgi:hypothetical protein